MERSVQLALFLLLSFPVLSFARGGFRSSRHTSAASSFCALTHYPWLCMMASSKRVPNSPMATNIEGVLRSNLVEISNQCTSAKKRAVGLVRRSGPKTQAALKECAYLYANAVDLIGVSHRELNKNDGQTRQMVQIMLQQVRQSAVQCSAQFQRGTSNPLAHLNGILIKMTNNADDLNNAMNSRNAARRS